MNTLFYMNKWMTVLGKTELKVKGFSLNTEESSQMNYQLMRDFILNEVELSQLR